MKNNNNPQELFQQAEALRKESQLTEAQKQYQQTIRLTNDRTQERGESRIKRADKERVNLRKQLYAYLVIPLMLAGIAFSVLRVTVSDYERQKTETDPSSFTFVEWLIHQQASEVMSNIATANPELNFDFSRSTSAMSPTEALQTMMTSAMQDSIKAHNQKSSGSSTSKGKDGEGSPAFNCSADPMNQCSVDTPPMASGEKREDIGLLVRSYRTVLNNEKDCSKIADAITSIGKKIQWRSTETDIKADLEYLALNCYANTKDYKKTIEQARRLQCSGNVNLINTSYWYLTASHAHLGETDKAGRMYTCFKETLDYLEIHDFSASTIASGRRESGALAWLYFNDLDSAVRELEAARNVLKKATIKTSQLDFVASEIDMDLMETYVTANIDEETFSELHDDINTSGLLTDGYKQIKDVLAGIYYLQNNKKTEASVALNNVATRFKHLPEYICSWDWSGFQRGLTTSITDSTLREKANQLVLATDCYVPQTIEERIQKVSGVLQWLNQ